MSDDWSLKYKKLEPEYDDDGIVWLSVPFECEGYFKSKDIDTLREKLIEDITGYVTVELHHDKSLNSHMNYVIKEIINKRFGIEEK